eukprot:jgi/Botrbrau1/22951/Bobra.0030s0025.1
MSENAKKRKPIVFSNQLNHSHHGHSAPARRKAWPEEKYNVKLPTAYLEDPHTHRFKRVKPTLDGTKVDCTPVVGNGELGGAGRELLSSREAPQPAGRKKPPFAAKDSNLLISPSPQEMRKQNRPLSVGTPKPHPSKGSGNVKGHHKKGPTVIKPTAVTENGLDLDKKLSLSLDALAKLNKGGAKNKKGWSKKH